MGLKLITDDKPVVVYRKERTSASGNTWSTYCIKVSSKDREDNWQSAFIDISFRKGIEVSNKAKIKIKESFPIIDTYNNVSKAKWMIMDFDIVEEGEQPEKVSDDGFMNIPDGVDDEGLPF